MLISLRDVLLDSQENLDQIESYTMKSITKDGEEKTLIIERNDMLIDGIECQVVNFIDITAYKRLEREK